MLQSCNAEISTVIADQLDQGSGGQWVTLKHNGTDRSAINH